MFPLKSEFSRRAPKLLIALASKHPLPIPLILSTWGAHYFAYTFFYPALNWNFQFLQEHSSWISLGTAILVTALIYKSSERLMLIDMPTFLSTPVGKMLSTCTELFLFTWSAPFIFPFLLGMLIFGSETGITIWFIGILVLMAYFVLFT